MAVAVVAQQGPLPTLPVNTNKLGDGIQTIPAVALTGQSERGTMLQFSSMMKIEASIGQPALAALSSMRLRPLAADAAKLVRRILVAAQPLVSRKLPPLAAIESDDGSILVEWAFDERRIGVAFEVNPAESSWYYVSSIALGSEMIRGPLATLDVAKLVRKVVLAVMA